MSEELNLLQKSFDDAVQENMDTFEMEREEAAREAADQLRAQGVNVQLIVTDGSTEELYKQLRQLQQLSQDCSDVQQLEAACSWMTRYCLQSVAHRCAAGRGGLYSLYIQLAERLVSTSDLCIADRGVSCNDDDALLETVVTSLTAVQTGQPDLLDNRGVSLIVTLLKQQLAAVQSSQLLSAAVIGWLSAVCQLHEANRRQLVDAGVLTLLYQLLEQLYASLSSSSVSSAAVDSQYQLLKLVCAAAVNFTLDDDVRVEFGNAHANSKSLVDLGTLKLLKKLISLGISNEFGDVLENILRLTNKLCVSASICEVLAAESGVTMVVNILATHRTHSGVCRRCMSLLATLAGDDKIRQDIIAAGSAPLIVSVMSSMKKQVGVCVAGLRAVSFLALRSAVNAAVLADAGAICVLVDLIKLYPQNSSVQKLSCMAVRNMASRSSDMRRHFLQTDIENLLNLTLKNHKDAEFEARAALRDLGCAVELRECWTGTGGALTTGVVLPDDH